VVVNIPNVGLSPKGIAPPDGGANLAQLSQIFDGGLNAQFVEQQIARSGPGH
jgi:hypothetical protein